MELFERLLALRNDLGLLSEEYDPLAGRLVGNFPQAFSHVSLINSAFRLSGHDCDSAQIRTCHHRRVAPLVTMSKLGRVAVKRRTKRGGDGVATAGGDEVATAGGDALAKRRCGASSAIRPTRSPRALR